MNLLRSILAVLFAIVIANPACCCAAPVKAQVQMQVNQPAKASHCCGEKKEKDPRAPKACACPTKDPRLNEDPLGMPGFTAIELPPVLPCVERIVLTEAIVSEVAPPDFQIDTGPPRMRLVLLQRFLI